MERWAVRNDRILRFVHPKLDIVPIILQADQAEVERYVPKRARMVTGD